MTEQLLEKVAIDSNGKTNIKVGDKLIDFKAPYQRISIYEAIEKYTGIDISTMDEALLRQTANDLDVEIDNTMGKGKLIDEIFGEKIVCIFVKQNDLQTENLKIFIKIKPIKGMSQNFHQKVLNFLKELIPHY